MRASRAGLFLGSAVVAVALAGCEGDGSEREAATRSTPTQTSTVEAPANLELVPRQLVPTLAELPDGYMLDPTTGPSSLSDELEGATVEEARLTKEGFIRAYSAGYLPRGLLNPDEPAITCRASVWRSSKLAGKLFRLSNQLLPEKFREEGSRLDLEDRYWLEPVSVTEQIGDETAVFEGKWMAAPIFIVTWRDSNVVSLCTTGSGLAPIGTSEKQQLLQLATAQHERIAAALK
jgi:hypothetical protein